MGFPPISDPESSTTIWKLALAAHFLLTAFFLRRWQKAKDREDARKEARKTTRPAAISPTEAPVTIRTKWPGLQFFRARTRVTGWEKNEAGHLQQIWLWHSSQRALNVE